MNTPTGILRDVLYVPGLGANLFSIGAAINLGVTAVLNQQNVHLFRNNHLELAGVRQTQGCDDRGCLIARSRPRDHDRGHFPAITTAIAMILQKRDRDRDGMIKILRSNLRSISAIFR